MYIFSLYYLLPIQIRHVRNDLVMLNGKGRQAELIIKGAFVGGGLL